MEPNPARSPEPRAFDTTVEPNPAGSPEPGESGTRCRYGPTAAGTCFEQEQKAPVAFSACTG